MTGLNVLNINQTTEDLKRVYETDYYWYLRSLEFHREFLVPLASFINTTRGCVDVGCGEGQLARNVKVGYVGVDACEHAIENARDGCYTEGQSFVVGRFEEQWWTDGFLTDSVVFGGILSVLVKPSRYRELIGHYLGLRPTYFILYDLERIDCGVFDELGFRKVWEYHATADVDGLQDEKKHRKILAYRC